MSDAGAYFLDPYREARVDIELRTPPRFHAPEGQSWVFGAKLGAGGFGRAYLWNLVSDADQKVVDRVVLKYTEVRTEQILSHGGLGHGQIREVFMQRSLVPNGTPPNQVFTVPLLGAEHCSWSLDAWRYYSPYFAFGDLHDLIATQGVETGSSTTGHRQIPEPFAWYLLYRLARAAVVMDTALRTSNTNYEVVHCDFKPENVFLGAPGSLGKNNSFPAYPPAYLGDFGNAHVTYPGDPNTWMMYGMCTVGWSAPEITRLPWGKEPWQVPGGSHTNIWQIGYIMQSILMGETQHDLDIDWQGYDYGFIPQYEPLPKRPKAREAENRLRRDYSPELLNILTAMVQFRVENRPTPQDLLHVIEENMPKFTQGMERWGTNEWFEELNRSSDIDTSTFDTSVDESMISMVSEGAPLRGRRRLPKKSLTESLTDKFKNLFCIPRSRRQRHRKTTVSAKDLSPFSAARAKTASRKRRQDMVTRQIREGLRPKLHRYVSPDPSDDIFILDDELKIIHPQRPASLLEYFDAKDPVPTMYREDIDDVGKYVRAKREFERTHGEEYPMVGVQKFDFRKEGAVPGEVLLPATQDKGKAKELRSRSA